MPTTLELLQAEKKAQTEEETRPPVCDVDSGRSLIANTEPVSTENITLELCVLRIEEFEKCFRLELIDRDLDRQFEELVETYTSLDLARHSKYVFQLSIWKNRNPELNHLEFRGGFSYRFENVHSLRLLYGNPTGSMQVRERLRVKPLAVTGSNSESRDLPLLYNDPDESSRGSGVGDSPRTPTEEDHASAVDSPPRAAGEMSVLVAPVANTLAKRKARKEESNIVFRVAAENDALNVCSVSWGETKYGTSRTLLVTSFAIA